MSVDLFASSGSDSRRSARYSAPRERGGNLIPALCKHPGDSNPESPGKTLLNLSDAKLCIISSQSRHRPPGIFGADIPGGKKGCIYKESAGELNQSS